MRRGMYTCIDVDKNLWKDIEETTVDICGRYYFRPSWRFLCRLENVA
jgi:hypothetical protein